jgi:hypothetical protein
MAVTGSIHPAHQTRISAILPIKMYMIKYTEKIRRKRKEDRWQNIISVKNWKKEFYIRNPEF